MRSQPAAARRKGPSEVREVRLCDLSRDSPGILLVIGYFTMVPPLLVVVSKFFQNMFIRMGFIRYMVMTNLLLMMMLLPIKMLARWTVNLKYFISHARIHAQFLESQDGRARRHHARNRIHLAQHDAPASHFCGDRRRADDWPRSGCSTRTTPAPGRRIQSTVVNIDLKMNQLAAGAV